MIGGENVEVPKIIATRQPPGDRWSLNGSKTIIEGLVTTLNTYYKETGFRGAFRLEPLAGKLFAIHTEKAPEPEIELWDLYGEEDI